jgi:RimJ/RimL family protein N-acetyltransferase
VPRLTAPFLPPGSLAGRSQPEIAGAGVLLRPWSAADVDAVLAGYTDPGIQRWHTRSMDAGEAGAWISSWPERWRAETGAGWAITADGLVAGQISLRGVHLDEGLAEVSYWVLPAARGRQIASRALGALAGWGLGELGLHRIEVEHSTANRASCRVAERAGFALEGTKRSQAWHTDGFHDMHLHAKIQP